MNAYDFLKSEVKYVKAVTVSEGSHCVDHGFHTEQDSEREKPMACFLF